MLRDIHILQVCAGSFNSGWCTQRTYPVADLVKMMYLRGIGDGAKILGGSFTRVVKSVSVWHRAG